MMDPEERDGMDIWDKVQPRRRMVPMPDGSVVYASAAHGATDPRARVEQLPFETPIDRNRPPGPAVPQPQGDRRWDMNRKAPPQWQRETDRRDKWTGQDGGMNPYGDPKERKRALDAMYQAGMNGDRGAVEAIPPGPFGDQMRRAFIQGEQARKAAGGR